MVDQIGQTRIKRDWSSFELGPAKRQPGTSTCEAASEACKQRQTHKKDRTRRAASVGKRAHNVCCRRKGHSANVLGEKINHDRGKDVKGAQQARDSRERNRKRKLPKMEHFKERKTGGGGGSVGKKSEATKQAIWGFVHTLLPKICLNSRGAQERLNPEAEEGGEGMDENWKNLGDIA